jgi:hypothetical protein
VAAALLLTLPLVWLHGEMPAPKNNRPDELVLWTPFFSIVRGEERKPHPAELPFTVLALAAVISSAKGWVEVLTGVRCGVMLKQNPTLGWREFAGWLLVLAAVVLALATVLGTFVLLHFVAGILA